MCITLMPNFRHDSPYYAPLSSSAWYLYNGTLSVVFRIFTCVALFCYVSEWTYRRTWETHLRRITRGMEKEFEEAACKAPSEIDGRALMWTYESLDEDHELEQFFAGIPGFCSSKVVDDPQSSLDSLRSTVGRSLKEFFERTLSSNLVSETIKIRRLVICVKAIDAAHLSYVAYKIFSDNFQHWPALLQSVELGHSLISQGNNDDQTTTLFAQYIIARIIANVPQRNERCFSLTMHHLGISEQILRAYLNHGESVFLANLTHFTRQFVRNFLEADWEWFPVSNVLRVLRSDFNVQGTLPSLQQDFCSLWNDVVLQRRAGGHYLLSTVLSGIRPIYVALHHGSTHSVVTLDQLCSIPSHHRGSASHSHEADGSRTAETARTPLTTSLSLHHHVAVPSPIPPVTGYDAPPSPRSRSSMNHTIPHLVDPQSRNRVLDNITPVASSLHPAPLGLDRISDGTAADPIQGPTISSIADNTSCSTSCHGIASRPTMNMTAATTSFVPDTVPPPSALLTASPVPAAPHPSADPTVNQSGGPPNDGSISHPLSQIFTPFTLALQVISGFDSNAATEIGPLDAPGDTLDPNRGVMPQSFTRPPPDVAGHSLRPDGEPSASETFGPSQ